MRILLLLLITVGLHAQETIPSPSNTTGYFHYVIETLAHDSMNGRLPGTAGEKKSAAFIASELKRTGSRPLKRKRFLFPFDYTGPDTMLVHSAGNVLAKVNTPSVYCIVITAHYDHIGNGEHHSTDPFDHSVHNGADDNASGVAMLLAMSAWCNAHQSQLKYDVIFAALSGEEDGLFGSQELLRSRYIDTSKIICNINLDMVGHLDEKHPVLVAEGALVFPAWDSLLNTDTTAFFTIKRTRVQVKGGSDHCTFIDAGIPAIMFTTGITGHYHRADDETGTVNFPGMTGIGTYMETLMINMQQRADLRKLFRRK